MVPTERIGDWGAQAVCFRVYAPVVFVFFVEVGKLAGKSSGTKLKDMRKTPNNIRDNKHRKSGGASKCHDL